MDFSKVKAGDYIKYNGDSWAFEGSYRVLTAESTYANPDNCPDDDKGKLMILEFMNDDTPMFFVLDRLNPKEWKLVVE